MVNLSAFAPRLGSDYPLSTARLRQQISRGRRGYLVGAGLRLEIQPAQQIAEARVVAQIVHLRAYFKTTKRTFASLIGFL